VAGACAAHLDGLVEERAPAQKVDGIGSCERVLHLHQRMVGLVQQAAAAHHLAVVAEEREESVARRLLRVEAGHQHYLTPRL
jgi:hypothetical protein